MISIYQERIKEISQYLHVPKAHDVVLRAIKKLQLEETEEEALNLLETNVAPSILQKLTNANAVKKLSLLEMLNFISHNFLLSTTVGKRKYQFVHKNDNLYSLEVQGSNIYIFELHIIPQPKIVALKRRQNDSEEVEAKAFCFNELPNLDGEPEQDLEYVRESLKGLRSNLKGCWIYLDEDRTRTPPSTSSTKTSISDERNQSLSNGE